MRTQLWTMDKQAVEPGVAVSGGESRPPSGVSQKTFTFVQRRIRDDQICILTFDRPDSSANIFDRATLQELDAHLKFIADSPGLQGVVLTSAKHSIFVAGADLHTLSGASAQDLASLIQLGQTVFDRLASLAIPTVAAIHGACVGGGFEVCLAGDYRVASPDRAT